jgi:hypothetical protein
MQTDKTAARFCPPLKRAVRRQGDEMKIHALHLAFVLCIIGSLYEENNA